MPNGARRQSRQQALPPLNDLPDPTPLSPTIQPSTYSEGALTEDLASDDLEPPLDDPESSTPPPAPPGLREISSLACWTVSSAKPGCAVAALRAQNTNLYWQSDGPQPHHLNVHFFKMVALAGIRIYLNFDLDESYTPTLVRFAAGTGYHDLQEFSVMKFERPSGWIDVDWEGVGDVGGEDGEPEEESALLRCMLVQVRICENHQNGKDTHLRGLQLFARDNTGRMIGERHIMGASTNSANKGATPKKMKDVWGLSLGGWDDAPVLR